MAKKILIAEDEQSMSKALSEMLTHAGFEVEVAQDGQEGIDKAVTERPDLIILDVLMPKKDGFEVVQELQKHDETRNLPIIMFTNLDPSSTVGEADSLNVFAYLRKTDTDLKTLVAEINKALDDTTLEEQLSTKDEVEAKPEE